MKNLTYFKLDDSFDSFDTNDKFSSTVFRPPTLQTNFRLDTFEDEFNAHEKARVT